MPTLHTDNIDIRYEDTGAGASAVVAIHGAAASSRCLDAFVAGLADDVRVIAPDLRGMGQSSRIASMQASSWNDDLCALLDELGLERVHLCGTSLGARIALRAAVDLPDRVETLTLDALILRDSERGAQVLQRIFGANADATMIANLAHWNGDDWRAVADTYLRLRETPGLQEHYDLGDALGQVACPVLLCRGDVDDDIHPIAHAVEAHAKLPDSRLWISPGTGFSTMRFAAEQAAEQVRRFVTGGVRAA